MGTGGEVVVVNRLEAIVMERVLTARGGDHITSRRNDRKYIKLIILFFLFGLKHEPVTNLILLFHTTYYNNM